jgi:hypothetical protein
MNLTPTIRECWTKEIQNDQGYKEVLKQVKAGKGMIDDKLEMDENRTLVWTGRLFVPEGFRKEVLKQK